MYSLAIHLYAFVVALISPFHKKARLMRFGQWKTNSILREKIDRNAKYIWFHASSLGEFEQGRPMIEKIKAEHPEYKVLLSCGSGEYRFISFPLYFAPTSYFSNGSESRTGRCYLILIIFLFRTSVR